MAGIYFVYIFREFRTSKAISRHFRILYELRWGGFWSGDGMGGTENENELFQGGVDGDSKLHAKFWALQVVISTFYACSAYIDSHFLKKLPVARFWIMFSKLSIRRAIFTCDAVSRIFFKKKCLLCYAVHFYMDFYKKIRLGRAFI